MALDRIWQLDVTGPASNSNYQSATIAENGPPSAINNALRALGSMVARELAWQASAISASVSTNLVTSSTGLYVPIVGSGAINNFGVIPGEQPSAAVFRIVEFSSSASLSHGSNLILVGGASRRTQPGDVGMYVHEGAGSQWRELFYSRADGSQLAPSISATTLTAGSISASAVSAVNMRASGAISAASMSVTSIAITAATSISASVGAFGILKMAGLQLANVTLQRTFDSVQGPQATSNEIIPHDDTAPLSTEGTQLFSRSITPKSATSKIRIEVEMHFSNASGAGVDGCLALFRGTTCIAVGPFEVVSTGGQLAKLVFEEESGSTTARTYSVRYGTSTASVTTVNDTAAGDYGNLIVSSMTITEYIP
jgi:hypothetical protein